MKALTDKQRGSYFSLDVENKVFADEAKEEITKNGAILPPVVSLAQLSNDIGLYEQIQQILTVIKNLVLQLSDTSRLAGHEAYTMSLTIHTLYKALAAAGVPGAQQSADRLGERFESIGRPPASNG